MLHLLLLLRQGTGKMRDKGLFNPQRTLLLKYRPEYLSYSCCCAIVHVDICCCGQLLNSGKDALSKDRTKTSHFLSFLV